MSGKECLTLYSKWFVETGVFFYIAKRFAKLRYAGSDVRI